MPPFLLTVRTNMSVQTSLMCTLAAGMMSVTGCVAPSAAAPAAESSASILASSRPTAGSTVTGPVDELVLHFDRPARLDEVTVSGPHGVLPMMLSPAGEVRDYSLPVSELDRGAYSVSWRATAAGQEYRGSFGFTVR